MPRRLFVTPGCCDDVEQHRTIFLEYLQLTDDEEGREETDMFAGRPEWATRAWYAHAPGDKDIGDDGFPATVEATFCPHCGQHVPEIIERPDVKVPICKVTDGGYYCATCEERLMGCECHPPEYKYQPKPAPPASDQLPSSA